MCFCWSEGLRCAPLSLTILVKKFAMVTNAGIKSIDCANIWARLFKTNNVVS